MSFPLHIWLEFYTQQWFDGSPKYVQARTHTHTHTQTHTQTQTDAHTQRLTEAVLYQWLVVIRKASLVPMLLFLASFTLAADVASIFLHPFAHNTQDDRESERERERERESWRTIWPSVTHLPWSLSICPSGLIQREIKQRGRKRVEIRAVSFSGNSEGTVGKAGVCFEISNAKPLFLQRTQMFQHQCEPIKISLICTSESVQHFPSQYLNHKCCTSFFFL